MPVVAENFDDAALANMAVAAFLDPAEIRTFLTV